MHWTSAPIRVPEKPLLTAGEIGDLFDVHAKTILRWVEEGRFPPPKRMPSGQARWTNLAVGVWLAWQDFAPDGPLATSPVTPPSAPSPPEEGAAGPKRGRS